MSVMCKIGWHAIHQKKREYARILQTVKNYILYQAKFL